MVLFDTWDLIESGSSFGIAQAGCRLQLIYIRTETFLPQVNLSNVILNKNAYKSLILM